MNTLLAGVGFVGASAVLALTGLYLIRRFAPTLVFSTHNETAGNVFAVAGGMYGVLLAFLTVIVWQQFDAAGHDVSQEADSLTNLYRLSAGFPQAQRKEMQSLLIEYTNTVIDREWDDMAQQRENPTARELVDKLWRVLQSVDPVTPRDTAIYGESLRRMTDFGDHRHDRLLDSRSDMPRIMWGLLLGGGIVTLGFVYLFDINTGWVHSLLTGALAGSIGFLIFLIYAIDNPFRGDVRVPPESFRFALDAMRAIQAQSGD